MQDWARCNKVLAYEVFFLRSNWIYLLRYLLIPRYNHDKIRREFRQQRQKIGILHFHCGGYFFCFSGIIFLTQKGPCRSHFCERQRPSAARFNSVWGDGTTISFYRVSVPYQIFNYPPDAGNPHHRGFAS